MRVLVPVLLLFVVLCYTCSANVVYGIGWLWYHGTVTTRNVDDLICKPLYMEFLENGTVSYQLCTCISEHLHAACVRTESGLLILIGCAIMLFAILSIFFIGSGPVFIIGLLVGLIIVLVVAPLYANVKCSWTSHATQLCYMAMHGNVDALRELKHILTEAIRKYS